ncbi:MAG: Ig-like domain-containing protein, partial [Anaerovoracaceae bacterium]
MSIRNNIKNILTKRIVVICTAIMLACTFSFSQVNAAVKAKSIKITNPAQKTFTLEKGKTKQFKIKTSPKSLAKKLKWTSSNKKIVTVTKAGKIKGIS